MSEVITTLERMIEELKALEPDTPRERHTVHMIIRFLERFVRRGNADHR